MPGDITDLQRGLKGSGGRTGVAGWIVEGGGGRGRGRNQVEENTEGLWLVILSQASQLGLRKFM